MENKIRIKMGEIATELRTLVGGKDLNGFSVPVATLEQCGILVPRLKKLLDEYDKLSLEELNEKNI